MSLYTCTNGTHDTFLHRCFSIPFHPQMATNPSYCRPLVASSICSDITSCLFVGNGQVFYFSLERLFCHYYNQHE